jgi:hypothetical protein
MDEIDDRIDDELLVVNLVVVKPVAIIILGQIAQKAKQFCRKSVECRHCKIYCCLSCNPDLS